jgi:hypothetical protein
VKHRERVVKGEIASEHLVQLFDEAQSRATAVSKFLYTGWKAGASLMIVSRPSQWLSISKRLEARGCPVTKAIAEGRLSVLDAETTLASFMVDGRPDEALFQATVGTAVERVCEQHELRYVYGEMVDILAGDGQLDAAQQLEALWNTLGTRHSFKLLCGYTSAHFADPGAAAALKEICALHTNKSAPSRDLLGRWLLSERRPRFHLEH